MKTYHQILIVDDDPILQSYLQSYLTQQGYTITRALEGEAMETVLREHTIDLILLDIMLPGKDGLYWLHWLQSQYPQIRVIMLTAKGSSSDRVQGLESGAADYLPKPFNSKELLIRIRNVLQGESKENNTIVSFGEYRFNTQLHSLKRQDQDLKLTQCEAELLAELCHHPNEIVTRDQLAQAVHGNEHYPLDRSIDVHINRLRKKIEENPSSPRYIHTAWGKGYKFQSRANP